MTFWLCCRYHQHGQYTNLTRPQGVKDYHADAKFIVHFDMDSWTFFHADVKFCHRDAKSIQSSCLWRDCGAEIISMTNTRTWRGRKEYHSDANAVHLTDTEFVSRKYLYHIYWDSSLFTDAERQEQRQLLLTIFRFEYWLCFRQHHQNVHVKQS